MSKSEQAEDALSRLNETRDRLLVEIRKGIIGQDEVDANTVQLKSMDQGGDQSEVPSGDLLKRIRG